MPNSNNTVDPALEIVYGLNDKPPLGETLFAALQHLLAITTGGLTAIFLNIILPRGGVVDERVKDEPEPATV